MLVDSFEFFLILVVCGGYVDLVVLLIERGVNLEEVNDEGYISLMEVVREGYEEMVGFFLVNGEENFISYFCYGDYLKF